MGKGHGRMTYGGREIKCGLLNIAGISGRSDRDAGMGSDQMRWKSEMSVSETLGHGYEEQGGGARLPEVYSRNGYLVLIVTKGEI